MPLVLRYAARSDVGLIRAGNEDSGYAGPALLVVADGMGGHAAGELASATVVATLAELQDEPPQEAEILRSLAEAVDDAGERIGQVANAQPDFAGMGTTATALFWNGERISIVHVGDSRAYLLRAGVLTQITHDHTYVQTLVDTGRITAAEARTHPRRSLIMRAIDGAHPVEPDVSAREAHVGDRYLLCSDGLTGVVEDDVLAAELASGDPPGAVTRLVELALEGGAPDNVTVVVADVVEVDEETAQSLAQGEPVVVGAAGEPRVRARLPGVAFPEDEQPDPDRPDPPPPAEGPPTRPTPVIRAPLDEPIEPDPDEYADAGSRSDRRRRILFWTAAVLGTAVVISALAWASTAWLRSQYFVGDSEGRIAIYNGVPGSLLGIPLQRAEETSLTLVSALPTFDQELVTRGITAATIDDARRIQNELERRAVACTLSPTPAGCPNYDPTVQAPAPLPTAPLPSAPLPVTPLPAGPGAATGPPVAGGGA